MDSMRVMALRVHAHEAVERGELGSLRCRERRLRTDKTLRQMLGVGGRQSRVHQDLRVLQPVSAAQVHLPSAVVASQQGATATLRLRPACDGEVALNDDGVDLQASLRLVERRYQQLAYLLFGGVVASDRSSTHAQGA